MIEPRTERPPFGALLRERRIAARLSQEQLAERAQISVQAVSALERGARRSPRADTLALLIRTLALTGADLVEFEASARASVANKVRQHVAPRDREAPAERTPVRPPGGTSFIGRESERGEIVRTLARHRCVTLWGPGGVGKTRLAIESLEPLSAAFGDRIAFVALAHVTDGESIVRAISAAYDLVDIAVSPLLTHLEGRFTNSRSLLVLDNCEHVVEHVSRFATAALARLPDLSILATSREPLRIDGEHVVPIAPLGVPLAVSLFLDRTAVSSGTMLLSVAADLERVATICRRLDGLPLAIELAAGRTRSMSVFEIERALDERFSLLTRGNRSLDVRQQTLRDTIGWSYALLDRKRRIVFERLALLNGPFAIEEAVAIAADASIDRWTVVDAVADLVDKALVGFASAHDDDDWNRPYTMLESTRVYAISLAEGERADADQEDAQRRFGVWLLARARESLDSFSYQPELEVGGIEIDQLRGYLRWAIDADGDVAMAAVTVGTLVHWWSAKALAREGLRWIERALAKLGSEPEHRWARARALLGKTMLLRTLSLNDEANAAALEAHVCALALDPVNDEHRRLFAGTSFVASESAAYLGRHEEAEALVRLSMRTYDELGDEFAKTLVLVQEARIATVAGDLVRGRRCYSDAMTYLEQRGHRRLAAHQRSNLAEIDYRLGDVAAAVDGAREAAEVVLELSSSYYVANTWTNLAAYLHDSGSVEEAAIVAGRALDVAREAGLDRVAAWAYQSCAIVGLLRGRDLTDAAAIFGFTLARIGDSALPYTERRRQTRLENLLDERLSVEARDTAIARGREMSDAEAYRLARAAIA